MKTEAERKCIVSGEVKEKEELLRFTLTPDGDVVPDFRKKLPLKGVYVSASKTALMKAVEKNLFTKAFKQKVKTSVELVSLAENILKKDGLDVINLARKAGVLVTGFEKVKEAVKKEKVAFILEAKDAGDDGHNKVVSLAKDLEVLSLYNAEEMDRALDKINTVHVAFMKSEMAAAALLRLKKFQTFLNS